MSYKGKITPTGTSEAIRIDKALFKQHPEFRQQAEVRADIIGPGNLGRGEPPDSIEELLKQSADLP